MEKDDNIVLLESPLGGNSVLEDEFEGKTQEDVVEIKEEDVVDLLECRKRKYSSAWDHFDLVREPSGQVVGVCKYCRNGKYTTKGRSGTTHLHRHLSRCTEYQKHLSKTESSSKTVDQLEYRRLLAQAILEHGYSFSWVEHEGNRKLHTRLNGDVQPICRKDGLLLIKPLVSKVRDGVRYIVGSEGRMQKFAECVKSYDVPISTKLTRYAVC